MIVKDVDSWISAIELYELLKHMNLYESESKLIENVQI